MSNQAVIQTLGLKIATKTPFELIKLARRGIPRKAINTLAKKLDLSISELAKHLPPAPHAVLGSHAPVSFTRVLQRRDRSDLQGQRTEPLPLDQDGDQAKGRVHLLRIRPRLHRGADGGAHRAAPVAAELLLGRRFHQARRHGQPAVRALGRRRLLMA